MYQVLDSYQRFNQKNNLIYRPSWDASLKPLAPIGKETTLRHIENGTTGFTLRDFALAAGARTVASSLGTEVNIPNAGLKSWNPLPIIGGFAFPEEKPPLIDTAETTKCIKRAARYFGASLVGIAKLNLRWIYSHHYIPETGETKPVEIDEGYKYIVTMVVGKDYDMIRAAPTAIYYAEAMLTYSKMALIVSSLAQFIRQLGYRAIPSLNDTGLNIPIAVDAGLGQVGRHGLFMSPVWPPAKDL